MTSTSGSAKKKSSKMESSKAWRALSVGEKTIYIDRAKRGRGENKKGTFVASLDPVLNDLRGKLMDAINDSHNRLVAAVDDELRKAQDHIQRQRKQKRKQQEEDGDDDEENGQEEDGGDDDENGQEDGLHP
ncbi:hypothetical protein QN277_023505 [Acacia crassicarpa]|uniref:Uncharacterized protein n=1 Tax=Acacia crassicarpa TaxID=499986 RepID=A0AAE1KD52_9FABA|nr:hypothetical protein QN277_023505 [Acacia crassicarpa]